jgi:hypothetical protein
VGPRVEVFPEEHLQAAADILGGTYGGLTGSEIGRLLAQCGIDDPYPDHTKQFRLCEALKARQASDRAGNAVVDFIREPWRRSSTSIGQTSSRTVGPPSTLSSALQGWY